MPGDPVHARGVRGRGDAGGGRGLLDDPHPRAYARRRALLRGRRLPRDHRGDPRRRGRRDRQLLDRGDRRAGREAGRLPARAAPRRGRAQHELDELREVLEQAQGLRLQGRVRELLRHDHRVPGRDERAGDQTGARVLRLGARGEPGPADRHGTAVRAASDRLRDGGERRHPSDAQEPRPHGRPDPRRRRGAEQLGRDRHRPRPVAAGGRGGGARRKRSRRPRGQLLSARRRDGALQWGADREGAPDGGGRRKAARFRRRSSAAARSAAARERMTALSDVRVLDLSRLLPGGFCSLLLADFGAQVLKVEDTGMGDYVRWSAPGYEGAEDSAKSALFLALNRGKRSIRLNLKDEDGRAVLLRLVREYDVLLESFRPGVMDRLGVGYERLRRENPGLVYCAVTGYGQDGPNTARSGHDMNYLGLNGVLGLTGEAGGAPVQPGGQIADLGGGALMAAFGIMAALRERDRSGEGQLVDVSMFDGSLSWLALVAAKYLADAAVPGRGELELAGGLICYRPYACRDGWVTLGALEPKFWQEWCQGVGREDLAEKQFEPPGSEAHAEVERVFLERTRDEWQAFASEHDCCLEPVLDLDEALDSELVKAREMVVTLDQPGAG